MSRTDLKYSSTRALETVAYDKAPFQVVTTGSEHSATTSLTSSSPFIPAPSSTPTTSSIFSFDAVCKFPILLFWILRIEVIYNVFKFFMYHFQIYPQI